jgi:hypothetical protein
MIANSATPALTWKLGVTTVTTFNAYSSGTGKLIGEFDEQTAKRFKTDDLVVRNVAPDVDGNALQLVDENIRSTAS